MAPRPALSPVRVFLADNSGTAAADDDTINPRRRYRGACVGVNGFQWGNLDPELLDVAVVALNIGSEGIGNLGLIGAITQAAGPLPSEGLVRKLWPTLRDW